MSNGYRNIWEMPLARKVGVQATIRFIKKSPEVTAIFACNDDVALGVLNGARIVGARVPDDLSVLGFDDIDAAVIPALTTLRVDKPLMGALAVRQLLDYAENPDRIGLVIGLRTQLVIRESVRSII